jgi:hypothetical protein
MRLFRDGEPGGVTVGLPDEVSVLVCSKGQPPPGRDAVLLLGRCENAGKEGADWYGGPTMTVELVKGAGVAERVSTEVG